MFVHAIRPPTARDLLGILAVSCATFALDSVENILPVLQIADCRQNLLDLVHLLAPLLYVIAVGVRSRVL
jgi:hypothetical protein